MGALNAGKKVSCLVIHPDECIDCGACVPEDDKERIWEDVELAPPHQAWALFAQKACDAGAPGFYRLWEKKKGARKVAGPGSVKKGLANSMGLGSMAFWFSGFVVAVSYVVWFLRNRSRKPQTEMSNSLTD